jgi:hypothetical protein
MASLLSVCSFHSPVVSLDASKKRGQAPFLRLSHSVLSIEKRGTVPLLYKKEACPLFLLFLFLNF